MKTLFHINWIVAYLETPNTLSLAISNAYNSAFDFFFPHTAPPAEPCQITKTFHRNYGTGSPNIKVYKIKNSRDNNIT